MSVLRPVVSDGARGHSGQLVAAHRSECGIPFVAARRSTAKLQEVMNFILGIAPTDYETAEVNGLA